MSIPRGVLEKYIKAGDVFVETGTKWGDTVIRAVELGAKVAWTCEVDTLQYAMARLHLQDALAASGAVVRIKNSFSVDFLAHEVYGADVVYLDAHTEKVSPVIGELSAIFKWEQKPRVILVDDIGLMESCWGVPVESIRASLKEAGYAISFEDGACKGDIMVGVRP